MKEELSPCSGKIETGIKTQRGRDSRDVLVRVVNGLEKDVSLTLSGYLHADIAENSRHFLLYSFNIMIYLGSPLEFNYQASETAFRPSWSSAPYLITSLM